MQKMYLVLMLPPVLILVLWFWSWV